MPSEPYTGEAVVDANNSTKRFVGKPWFFGSLSVTLVCAITLIVLALQGVSTADFGYWPHLLILLAVAIFITASLAITEVIPWSSRSFKDWQQPKVLGSFVGLIMGAVGLAAGLVQIFEPPRATEQTVADIRDKLTESGVMRGQGSLVEQHIRGAWGEPGCQVTYDVALANGELTIASAKSVSGQNPFHMQLKAEPGTGSRLVASVWQPLQQRGEQHVFVLEKAGSIESLTWTMQKRETPLRLDRCPQG